MIDAPRKVCNRCHGQKFVFEKLYNYGKCEYVEHLLTCDQCEGKGYTDENDHRRYLHSMGVIGAECCCS